MGPSLIERAMSNPWWGRARTLSITVYQEMFRTRAFTMAAAMSYYFLLSLVPLLIFLSAVLGYLPIPNLFDQLLDMLAVLVPPDAMQMVERILTSMLVPHRGGLLSFGMLSYLWTASGAFAAAVDAINVAYDVPQTRAWWSDRLRALGLTLTIGLLGVASLLLILAGPRFGHFLTELFPLPNAFGDIWPVLRIVTIFVGIVVGVEVQYYFAPNRKQRFIDTLPGALFAVSGIFLSSSVLSYYFSHFANYNKTYGSLGAVIILMLWFYVVGVLVIAGAELNAELLKQLTDRGERSAAQVISRDAERQAKGVPAA